MLHIQGTKQPKLVQELRLAFCIGTAIHHQKGLACRGHNRGNRRSLNPFNAPGDQRSAYGHGTGIAGADHRVPLPGIQQLKRHAQG